MSLDPKTIYVVQRSADGTVWEEINISGSNLVLQTDVSGSLAGEAYIPENVLVYSSSYARTASYSETASYSANAELSGSGIASSSAQVVSYITGQQISPAGITSSLFGTASYSSRGMSASYSETASYSNLMQFGDGTATSPSITFASDQDTGFYRTSANQVGFTSGGSQSLWLAAGGRLYGAGVEAYVEMPSGGGVNIVAAGSNKSVTVTPSGTGGTVIQSNSNNGDVLLRLRGTNSTPNGAIRWQTSTDTYTVGIASRFNIADNGLEFLVGSNTTAAALRSNGNFLLGTNTDSSNGRIQLATHTTSGSGVGFATDTSLFRDASGSLTINGAGANPALKATNNGSRKWDITCDSANVFLAAAAAHSLVLQSAGTTALSLDSSQNATFAGKVTISGGEITGSAGGLRISAGGTNQNVVVAPSGTGEVFIKADGTGVLRATYIRPATGFNLELRAGSGSSIQFANAGGSEWARFSPAGNLLLGTTTDSSNGRLQVAGAIALGTVGSMPTISSTAGSLDLSASGSNQNITFTPSGLGQILVKGTTGSAAPLGISFYPNSITYPTYNGARIAAIDAGFAFGAHLAFYTHPADGVAATAPIERGRFTQTGNLLIGTTTDSSNGRLQLTTHTSSAGGIGFGTDTNLYRVSAGILGTNARIQGTGAGNYIDITSANVQLAGSTSVNIYSNGTNALVLDASQNATFSGATVTLSKAGNNPNYRVIDGSVISKLQSLSVGSTSGVVGTESPHNFSIIVNNSPVVEFDSSLGSKFNGNVTLQSNAPQFLISGSSGRILLSDTGGTATSRNWAIAFSEANEGDLLFKVSTSSSGSAVAGTTALGFDRDGNATFRNVTSTQITASAIQVGTLHVQTVTSSIVYASGSNRFGSLLTDSQEFTGSLKVTGSLFVRSNVTASGDMLVLGNISASAVRVADGAAAVPAIGFSANGDTGIYRLGTNEIAISSGGTAAWKIARFGGMSRIASVSSAASIRMDDNGAIYFDATGTNQNIISAPSGTGRSIVLRPRTNAIDFPAAVALSGSPTNGDQTGLLFGFNTNSIYAGVGARITDTGSGAMGVSFYAGTSATGASLVGSFVSSGSLLLGTTTDSANGRIQLATHSGSMGGIGFGTDTVLYRSAANILTTSNLSNSGVTLMQAVGGISGQHTIYWGMNNNNGTGDFGSSTATAVRFVTNGTSAFSIDTSQNVTFTGRVIASQLTASAMQIGSLHVTGSTKFGGQLTDVHQFTGSLRVTGSLNVDANVSASRLDIAGTVNSTVARIGSTGQYLSIGSYTPNSGGTTLGYNGVQYFGLNAFFGAVLGRGYVSGVNTPPSDGLLVEGKVLIGKTTDTGNGFLQLPEGTTSGSGIGFGGTASLYRTSGGNGLELDLKNSPNAAFFIKAGNGAYVGGIQVDSTNTYLDSQKAGSGIVFRTNGTTAALSLDSAQNATFAGKVTVSGGEITGSAGGLKIFAGGTDQHLTLQASGNARTFIRSNSTAQSVGRIQSDHVAGYSSIDVHNNSGTQVGAFGYANASASVLPGLMYAYSAGAFAFATGGTTEKARITASGSLLIGKVIDNGNGVIQLNNHATSSGGIGLGDIAFYRSGAGFASLNAASGSAMGLDYYVGGVRKAYNYFDGSNFEQAALVGSLVLKSNNSTALTLDNSQNAQFVGAIKVSGSASQFGTGNFAKSSFTTGNISFDNGTTDTPGLHFYYANNSNFGIDAATGALRVVSNLDESGGNTIALFYTSSIHLARAVLVGDPGAGSIQSAALTIGTSTGGGKLMWSTNGSSYIDDSYGPRVVLGTTSWSGGSPWAFKVQGNSGTSVFESRANGDAIIGNNLGLAADKLLTLNGNVSAAGYALQAATSGAPYDFRFIGDFDSVTQRWFSFGHYTSNNSANTWQPRFRVNSYTGDVTVSGSVSIGANSPTTARLNIKGTSSDATSGLLLENALGNTSLRLWVAGNASDALSYGVIGRGTNETIKVFNDQSVTFASSISSAGNLAVNAGSGTNTFTLRDAVFSKTAGSSLTVSSGINPSTDNGLDLGSPSLRWANGYFGSSLVVNGSAQFTGSVSFTQLTASAITVGTLHVQTITSSIVYASGSNKFGTLSGDTHQFTGSILAKGNIVVDQANTIGFAGGRAFNYHDAGSMGLNGNLYLSSGGALRIGRSFTDGAGTAAAPLYSFNDQNTGIYAAGTGQIGFACSGIAAGFLTYIDAGGGLDIRAQGTNKELRLAASGTAVVRVNSPVVITGSLDMTGSFSATVKSFVIDHPTKPGYKLEHGVTEGPEHSVFYRGKSTGSLIELPEYWAGLVHEDSITVQLTPIGKFQELVVEEVSCESITVSDSRVGSTGMNYYYYVMGTRKDIPKLVPEFN